MIITHKHVYLLKIDPLIKSISKSPCPYSLELYGIILDSLVNILYLGGCQGGRNNCNSLISKIEIGIQLLLRKDVIYFLVIILWAHRLHNKSVTDQGQKYVTPVQSSEQYLQYRHCPLLRILGIGIYRDCIYSTLHPFFINIVGGRKIPLYSLSLDQDGHSLGISLMNAGDNPIRDYDPRVVTSVVVSVPALDYSYFCIFLVEKEEQTFNLLLFIHESIQLVQIHDAINDNILSSADKKQADWCQLSQINELAGNDALTKSRIMERIAIKYNLLFEINELMNSRHILLYLFIRQMGYNSNCYYSTCAQRCCNSYGTCPEDYSSSYYSSAYTTCYYYYDNYYQNTNSGASSGGGIAGIVIGCIIAVVIVIALILYFKRKNAAESQLAQQAAMGNTSGNQTIIIPPNHQQPYGQPVYGQPVYNQPYVQPPVYNNQYPQQQGPIIITS